MILSLFFIQSRSLIISESQKKYNVKDDVLKQSNFPSKSKIRLVDYGKQNTMVKQTENPLLNTTSLSNFKLITVNSYNAGFISTWQTNAPGITKSTEIKLP